VTVEVSHLRLFRKGGHPRLVSARSVARNAKPCSFGLSGFGSVAPDRSPGLAVIAIWAAEKRTAEDIGGLCGKNSESCY
jgi:hypothetical protein